MRVDSTTSFVPRVYAEGGRPSREDDRRSAGRSDQPVEERSLDDKVGQRVQELKVREQKVRAHEMAHKAAGGEYAGAVRYQYTKGPDGQAYISGGEVSIDTSEEKTPKETLRKMQQVERAALAPADPSPEDYSVASVATRLAQKAHYELMKANYEKNSQPDKRIVDTAV